jgi:drug/metabolite transporter (DMT)-like permease
LPAISRSSDSRLGLLALILGACAIGFAPIFVRLSEIGPVATGFHRLAWSLPVFALMAWRAGEDMPNTRMAWGGLTASGLFFAGDLIVWHLGIMLTSVANATLFSNLAPVFVTIGLWVIWGLRPSLRFVVALTVTLAGAVMLMGGSFTVSTARLTGDALSMLSGLFYGGYIIAVGRMRASVATSVLMLVGGAIGALAVLAAALALGETVMPVTVRGWAMVVGLGLVSQVGGQGLIAWGLKHLPASFGALVLSVQPVVAAAVAWGLFGEVLGPFELVGAGIVLVGIHLARRANA